MLRNSIIACKRRRDKPYKQKKSPHAAGLNPFLGEEVEETAHTLPKICCIATFSWVF